MCLVHAIISLSPDNDKINSLKQFMKKQAEASKTNNFKRKREDTVADDEHKAKRFKMDTNGMLEKVKMLLQEMNIWNRVKDVVEEAALTFTTTTIEDMSTFRKQTQEKIEQNVAKSIESMKMNTTYEHMQEEHELFMKQHLIKFEESNTFNLESNADEPIQLPEYIEQGMKHWKYQQKISEMQYQQSGIYPLISSAFSALQEEQLIFDSYVNCITINSCSNMAMPKQMFGNDLSELEKSTLGKVHPDGAFYFFVSPVEVCPVLFVENSGKITDCMHKDWIKLMFTMRWALRSITARLKKPTSVFGILTEESRVQFIKMTSRIHTSQDNEESVISYTIHESIFWDLKTYAKQVYHILANISKEVSFYLML